MLNELKYQIYNLFYPGPALDWAQWESFCNLTLFFSLIASGIALGVFVATAYSRHLTTKADVFENGRCYRLGIITAWVVVFVAALIIVLSSFLPAWRSFLDLNVLLFLGLCACLGWLLYSVAAYFVTRQPFMNRYRRVTLWSRKLGGSRV